MWSKLWYMWLQIKNVNKSNYNVWPKGLIHSTENNNYNNLFSSLCIYRVYFIGTQWSNFMWEIQTSCESFWSFKDFPHQPNGLLKARGTLCADYVYVKRLCYDIFILLSFWFSLLSSGFFGGAFCIFWLDKYDFNTYTQHWILVKIWP